MAAPNGGDGGIARPYLIAARSPAVPFSAALRRTGFSSLLAKRVICFWLQPNGGDGGIGEALPHRCAITCGAPSPLRFVEPGSHPCSLSESFDLAAPNGGDGGIGEALPHRCAITCGAPSPLRFVEPGSHPCSPSESAAPNGGDAGLVRPCLTSNLRVLRCASSNRVLIPARQASHLIWLRQMAETAGFEPAEPFLRLTSLAKKRFRPLSHVSIGCKLVDLYLKNQLKFHKIIFELLPSGGQTSRLHT